MASGAVESAATRAMSVEAKTLTAVVTRLRRALRTSIRTDYPWESLPMAQVELLLALDEHGSVRVGELATLLRLAPNTVSGLVQVLVENGLVTRVPDASDRRVAVVALTAAGHLKLDDWARAHEQRIGNALDRLAPDDRVTVRAALPALARLVDHLATPDLEAAGGDGPTI
ncbi:MAG TPA: MarR family transcriptional regulator [Cellulomonas sp.]|uniref:MarR family winged helix-turn-helix transcriptional regulator n=1 Tax=Cellulomonas sp. TaxID=40001 RepID=UPI002E3594A8|nr:MarR family transcriptional regulator [Cellulomonas sp.]HEX5333112.1 MarR family transcriptional regulator [Cellulomonas sp.]